MKYKERGHLVLAPCISSTQPGPLHFSIPEHTHRHLQAKDECDIQSGIL
jgi:hypothetical protein